MENRLEIFNQPDPSGKFSKESYISKFYPKEYNYIIDYSLKNGLEDLPFKERVYLSVNSLESRPRCKNPECENFTKFINSNLGYREFCSNKCLGSDPNIKLSKQEKSLKKWGTKSPSQSDLVKSKIIKTNNIKYGGNSPTSSKDIRDKIKSKVLQKWGVENVAQNDDVKKSRIESFRKSDFVENFKKTSLKKWGVDHPWKDPHIHLKTTKSSKLTRNELIKNIILDKLEKIGGYEFIEIDYDQIKRNITIECKSCQNSFQINREEFHIRYKNKTTICTICNPRGESRSGQELQIINFIKDNYKGEVLVNTKSIIRPKEIDIFLPELKIGFEYNGLYWHSESEKGRRYHFEKTRMCQESGVELIHIWEDDWVYKNEIVKSILLNKLGKIGTKIGARNCRIVEISDLESRNFLDENHILGGVKSKIRIGLMWKGEIVSLMTFSIFGDGYSLTRFCSKINHSVFGAASKIFRYFVDHYKPNLVITYSDQSIYTGDVYQKLGFTFDGMSPINYKWVISGKRVHKSKFRKSKLGVMGYDITKTETSIMVDDVGAFKVWDCGLKRWIFKTN